jgi:TolB-like protein
VTARMSDIFISYARSTASQAQAVAAALRSLGYDVWLDDELPAHRAYADVIDEQLLSAKAVVAIWSAEAVKSQWVRSEADAARRAGTLVQLSVDGVAPPRPFDQIQCANLNGWAGDINAPGWRKIAASVEQLVRPVLRQTSGASPKPAPSTPATVLPLKWHNSWRVGAAAAVILLLAAGTAFFILRSTSPRQALVSETSSSLRVAVLPFRASDSNSEARALADTLPDEVASALSADHIEMLASTDNATLKDSDANTQIARLGVGLVVDGVVRTDGDTLIVRVHLDDAVRHVTVWSKTFTAPVQKASGLRAQIAADTAHVTQLAVSPAVKTLRDDPSVLGAFLDGYEEFQNSFGRSARSLAIFRDVAARAPTFSLGHSMLAATVRDNSAGLDDDARLRSTAQAEDEAKVALSLDSKSGQAWSMLATDTPLSAWRERERLLLKGLAVDPNQDNLHKYFQRFLNSTGRNREALEQGLQTVASDHFDIASRLSLAHALAMVGRFEEADAAIADAKRLWPDNSFAPVADFQVAVWSGQSPRHVLALLDNPIWRAAAGPILASDFWTTYFRTLVSGDAARKQAGVPIIENAVKTRSIDLGDAILALTRLGNLDAAFQVGADASALKRIRAIPAYFSQIAANNLFAPAAAPLRQDRRFMALAARLGLADYWRSSGNWPDFCDEPGLPYDCKAEAERLSHPAHGK